MAVTVFFDGDCPLCQREIALMKRLDRRDRLSFVDVAANAPENCPVDAAQLLDRFHVMEHGSLRSGAAAFAAMWRQIPLLWLPGQIARLAPVEWLLEHAYRAFLRIRPRLQRLLAKH